MRQKISRQTFSQLHWDVIQAGSITVEEVLFEALKDYAMDHL